MSAASDCFFYFQKMKWLSDGVEDRYLGSRPIWNFTTGNNALKGTKGMRQPVHKDITFKHPTVSIGPCAPRRDALVLIGPS